MSWNFVSAIMNKKHQTTEYRCVRASEEALQTAAEHVKSVIQRRMYDKKAMDAGTM